MSGYESLSNPVFVEIRLLWLFSSVDGADATFECRM